MDLYLLDSSVILDILDGNEHGREAARILGPAEACTSVICRCEVLNKVNLQKITKAKELLSKIPVFGLTTGDGETAEQLQYSCRKTGVHTQTLDCLIAATAVNNYATVLTSDADFERIQQVEKIVLK